MTEGTEGEAREMRKHVTAASLSRTTCPTSSRGRKTHIAERIQTDSPAPNHKLDKKVKMS